MTTYTVAADGTTSPTNPPFPQSIIGDTLQPDGTYDTTTNNPQVFITGGSYTLQSLFIGTSIEVDLGGGLFGTGNERLTGSGSITGATPVFAPDLTTSTPINPAFVNSGFLDINGAIAVALTNNATIAVSSGERLDVEGDFTGTGASTITVASGAELDLNSQNTVNISGLSSQGTLKITAPNARITGTTTLGGTVLVQGDAQNGAGSGTLAPRTTAAGNGTYVAALDLRNATFTAPINSLTLGGDASISFGTGTTAVARFAVAGSSTGLAPLDLVKVDGTLRVTGDGTGAANQVVISQAEFAGSAAATGTGNDTIDFAVAASDGGASLQRQITVDANTVLRNDAAMTIGGQGTATTTIGATGAAAGSSFINGTGAQLTIAAGAALSVASLQNAGAITVAGNASFLQSFINTGTVDVTAGTLSLEAAIQGSGGTFAVESGATLALDAASAQAVAIRNGGTLRLSQPANFTGTLQLPATGARIDLAGISATSAVVSNGSIFVTTANSGNFQLAETGLVNGSSLGLSTDGAGGSLLTVAAPPTATNPTPTPTPAQPVAYRFFDSIHGTQFLTTSDTERQTIQNTRPDLVYEGVGLTAVNPATDSTAAPVYRFFDTKFGTHFYTSSATERDTVLATRTDLVSEGIGFYEHNTQQAGDSPVYRFFDSNFGTHFYTASNTERANIVATRPDLIAEGVSFYAPASATV